MKGFILCTPAQIQNTYTLDSFLKSHLIEIVDCIAITLTRKVS